jgi:hypothetical protein
MVFKAEKTKAGLLVHGVEEFIEAKLHELSRALGLKPKAAPRAVAHAPVHVAPAPAPAPVAPPAPVKVEAKSAPKAKAPKAVKPAKKTPVAKVAVVHVAAPEALDVVLAALAASPKKAQLVKAGKQKDQLLRSLIPLYLARGTPAEVSSGVTSKFWAKHGVTYAAPNAAKALREHEGYAKRTKTGPQITPQGVKYVEAALTKQP